MQATTGSSSVSNDRLKKAIERNRARQAKRDLHNSDDQQSDLFSSNVSKSLKSKIRNKLSNSATRTGVARPENFQFESNIESRANKFKSSIAYKPKRKLSLKRAPKKITSPTFKVGGRLTKKKKEKLILKCAWAICLALFVRLIFTDGGIWDYKNQKTKLSDVKKEIIQVKKENSQIVNELKLIKTSNRYRKELVRNHLGFISSDEYLVLFAKNN